jgi:hypothetical protein
MEKQILDEINIDFSRKQKRTWSPMFRDAKASFSKETGMTLFWGPVSDN